MSPPGLEPCGTNGQIASQLAIRPHIPIGRNPENPIKNTYRLKLKPMSENVSRLVRISLLSVRRRFAFQMWVTFHFMMFDFPADAERPSSLPRNAQKLFLLKHSFSEFRPLNTSKK
ncbi:hypothetical protein CDAR_126041 [Caerostris darwini]|uniref:Uncharacterized protein n=1 Tax=Caerostris darwini TaxID=1538125 RepID=A0AAV4SEQ9_9ARAC|nr:hypothetical protein CDAR_126041 [Caerostris darwini]